MPQLRILVIEDHPTIRRGLINRLRQNGFEVQTAVDYAEGLRMALAGDYDLLLLDLVLPGGSGLDILQRVRATSPALPIIILSAQGEEHERVRGLNGGADDYVTKPFSGIELVARIEALLRRVPGRPQPSMVIPIPGGRIDLSARSIYFDDGSQEDLSERESELVGFLVQERGRVVTRHEILSRVWRLNPDTLTTRTIDVHVGRLREKLRDDSTNPRIIRTQWGKGYQFIAEVETPGI